MGVYNFYQSVTTNPTYRAAFIKDPIKVLAQEGITLSQKDQQELLQLVKEIIGPNQGPGNTPRFIP